MTMTLETNKAHVQGLIDVVWNGGHVERINDFLDVDVVVHDAPVPGLPPGAEGARRIPAMWRTAFPDIHVTNEQLIAEGDRVAQRWTLRGTHGGPLFGFEPTGKKVEFRGVNFFRLAETERGLRIVERWADYDAIGLMRQLGVIPA